MNILEEISSKRIEDVNKRKKIIPLENIINETKQIKAIHNLIKNNGQNFEISEEEKRLAYNLAS